MNRSRVWPILLLSPVIGNSQVLRAGPPGPALDPQEPLDTVPTMPGCGSRCTDFSYQGRLTQMGVGYDGTADFQVTLWTLESEGTQIDQANFFNAVDVEQGLFSILPDFGVGAFDGGQRFLELAVRTDPGQPYTTLTPRQPITSAPYATFASAPWVINPTEDLYYDNGRVGIGTSAPATRLEVVGTTGPGILYRRTDARDARISVGDPTRTWSIASGWNTAGDFSVIEEGVAGDRLYIQKSTGNVGIGTASPTNKLSVAGTIQSTAGGFMFPDGTVQASAGSAGLWSANGTHIFNTNADNVGIGTTAPQVALHVQRGAAGVGPDGNSIAAFEKDSPAYLSFLTPNGVESGILFGKPIIGSASGGILYDTAAALRGLEFRTNNNITQMVISGGGNVGIGMTAPASRLDVLASGVQTAIRGEGQALGARGVHGRSWSEFGVFGESLSGNAGVYGTGPVNGVIGDSPTGDGVWGGSASASRSGVVGFNSHANGYGGYFTNAAGGLALWCDGRAQVRVLEITGADLAEKFPTSDCVEPGMVVEIDPDAAGQLRLSREAYNRRVAGVVSGAGDLSAGAILGNLPGHEDAPPIALTGRVWVHCDANGGPIEPGDLLTTSDTPGHAMKATDFPRAQGAIIGKAMSSLAADQSGLVLVLVSLQ